MKYSREEQRYHIERIRQVLVMFPNASLKEMRGVLANAKPPLIFNTTYIKRLKDAVFRERAWRLKNNTVVLRIAEVEDRVREIQKFLWTIAQESKFDMARVLALKELGKLEFDLLSSQMDAGVFERNLGTVNVRASLDPEQAVKSIETLQKWGLVKEGVVPMLDSGTKAIESSDDYDFIEDLGEDTGDAEQSDGSGGGDARDRDGAGASKPDDDGGPVLAPVQPLPDPASGTVPLQPS